MIHDPALLDALERFDTEPWQGRIYRHMLGSAPPELANERGARWNPPGTSALYTSLTETTAKAEGDHVSRKALKEDYPHIPEEAYEVAALWARGNPSRGRPLRRSAGRAAA